MLPDTDRERLLHMRDAATEAMAFVQNLSWETFQESPLVQHGVQHCLFIIGEAASRISEETRLQHPEVEWPVIRGIRNRLAHAYFAIDLSIIWDTVTGDLPRLLALLDRILDE